MVTGFVADYASELECHGSGSKSTEEGLKNQGIPRDCPKMGGLPESLFAFCDNSYDHQKIGV